MKRLTVTLLFFWLNMTQGGYLFNSFLEPQLTLLLKSGEKRQLGRLGALIPLKMTPNKHVFFNIFGLWDSQSVKEGNIGLGYRYQLDEVIFGVNGFFDQKLSHSGVTHHQLGLGGDLFWKNLQTSINGYIPLTGAKKVLAPYPSHGVFYQKVAVFEKPLYGLDMEIGGFYQFLSGFLSYYHFNGKAVKSLHGLRLRGNIKLTPQLSLLGEMSHDSVRKTIFFVGIQLQLKSASSSKMMSMIKRDMGIVTGYEKRRFNPKKEKSYCPQKDLTPLDVKRSTSFKMIRKGYVKGRWYLDKRDRKSVV